MPLALRRLTSRLVRGIPVRIRGGPNRGLRWSLAAAGRGFWSGSFEAERTRALAELVRSGDRFWDGGAHQGYITLLASRRVGPTGSVTALEPSGYNRWYLERHVAWNDLDNVRVLPVALAADDGRRSFDETGSSVTFRVGRGNGRVPARRPSTLVEEVGAPTFVKLDIEGGEEEVMEEVLELLPSRGAAFVALHSPEADRRARELFSAAGFRVLPSARLRAYRKREEGWPGDPDLVALGPDRPAERAEVERLPFFGPADC
mgnify:CR=1 FL=1